MHKHYSRALLISIATSLITEAHAASDRDGLADTTEQIVVTGTRRAQRVATDSNVPVDAIDASELRSIASTDLNDKLAHSVPSFNVQRMPLFDGQIFVRPATLRGLSPDQTLVLVNGVRRHRSAFIDPGLQSGAQAVDLSQVPQIALKRVEVLRDGASAQYGSDAIAGVINLILEDRPGWSFEAQTGSYFAGDGNNVEIAGRGGVAIGERGAAILSLEYANSEPTDRGAAVNRIGQPELRAYRSFFNVDAPVGETASLYSFGNYSHLNGQSDFNYRSVGNNVYARSYFQDHAPLLNPDYSLSARYPNGFIPIFGARSDDSSVVAGARGQLTPQLSWDLNGRYGRNEIDYSINHTINASLGRDSPTAFDIGNWQQVEHGANLGFNYLWDVGLAQPVNVATGAEWREEQFKIIAGTADSYRSGPYSDLIPGANGFPGFSPAQSGEWSRSSTGAYLDLDSELTQRLAVDVAGRFEHYSDFGSTSNFKIAGRFKALPTLNLRAAFSTGFRAPTPAQQHLTKTSQNPDPDFPPPAPQVIITSGLVPSISPVAAAVGGKPLTAEKSRNYSIGLVLMPAPTLTLALDFYRIDIDRRLGATATLELSDVQRAALVAAGVTSAATLDQFSFFMNGYDTRTEGFDLTGTYDFSAGPGNVRLSGALNHNSSTLTHGDPAVVSDNVRQYVEERLPRDTANLALSYDVGRFGVLVRGRHYGAWTDALPFLPAAINQRVGAETFVDIAASWALSESIRLTVGVENLLDNYPDHNVSPLAAMGHRYPVFRAYEADGGRYYARALVSF